MRTKVFGVIYPNADGSSRQQILKRMRKEEREYEAVYFEPEPSNDYNKIAVKVLNKDKEQLGYLSTELATDIAKRISGGEKLFAVITSFTGGYEDNSIVECNIDIMSAQTEMQNVVQEEQHKKRNISDSTLIVLLLIFSFITLAVFLPSIQKNIKANKPAAKPYTHSYLKTSSDFVAKPTITTSEDLKALSDFRKSLDKKLEEQKKAEAMAKKTKKRKETKKSNIKQEPSASQEGYKGGTLVDKKMSDWKKATQANKLATCGDIVAFSYKKGKLNFFLSLKDTEALKKYAQILGFTMDLALYSNPDDKDFLACPVSLVAAVSMAYLGWLK